MQKTQSAFASFLLLAMATVSIAQDGGLELKNFDKSIRAQDDLYRFVNGSWLKKTEIPADKSNYGSFTALSDLSQLRIRQIVEMAASKQSAPGSDEQKVGDFFKSYMNEAMINKLGAQPIASYLKEVDALETHDAIFESFGKYNAMGVGSPVAVFVGQDAKESSKYIVQMFQSGTSLPSRHYLSSLLSCNIGN